MIIINGLMPRQIQLLDAMWECDTYHKLELLMTTLSDEDVKECGRLRELMLLAAIDEDTDTCIEFPEAMSILTKFM